MPTTSEVFTLGKEAYRAGDWPLAEQCFRQVLQAEATHVDALLLLGAMAHQQGKYEQAAADFERLVRLRPADAIVYYNLGRVYQELGKQEEAANYYQQALQLQPDLFEAILSLGNVFLDQRQVDKALACYRRAVQIRPEAAESYLNLGNALVECGELDQAATSYERALCLRADFAEAHDNLGNLHAIVGRLDQALAEFDEAIRLKPDLANAHWNRALAWLLRGDFTRGWQEHEWRFRRNRELLRSFREPLWDGSRLDGRTILLHAEQGLGDAIQFIRYAALVKKRCGQVVVECPPRLVQLLTGCPGIDQLVARGSPLPYFDVQAPLSSLPLLFRTSLETVPAAVPYLFADPELVKLWRQDLASLPGFKIGIAWQGNPSYIHDRRRSIPLAHFAALSVLAGVHLITLQKGPGREQLQDFPHPQAVTDLAARLDETVGPFLDTAAVMKNLDLIITSDTVIAHLAGALGVPAWVPLWQVPDWRWLLEREDSPWYPTLRLFRQRRWGDWDEVFRRMAAAVPAQQALRAPARSLLVELPPGDVIDRMLMLELESAATAASEARQALEQEVSVLRAVCERALGKSEEVARLTSELRAIHERLQHTEDGLRACEQDQEFGQQFVELARALAALSNRRRMLRQQITASVGIR
jgi:tetratricopeptide (TPR) repeat protein